MELGTYRGHRVAIAEDYEGMSRAWVDHLVRHVQHVENPRVMIASGTSTSRGNTILAEEHPDLLRRLTLYHVDEYVVRCGRGFRFVDAQDPVSFHRQFYEEMDRRLPFVIAHVWPGLENAGAPGHYDELIRSKSGGELDYLVLGLGANGHFGFCEPGTLEHAPTHLARLAIGTRRVNAALTGHLVPPYGITIGPRTLNLAAHITQVASGARKAGIVERVLEERQPRRDLPSTEIHRHNDHALWILDRDAASELDREVWVPL